MRLEKNRKKIEEIDQKIIDQLKKRQEIIEEIANIKQKKDLPIEDEEREKQLISKVTDRAAEEGMNSSYIKEIFQKIHEMSRAKQHTLMGDGSLP